MSRLIKAGFLAGSWLTAFLLGGFFLLGAYLDEALVTEFHHAEISLRRAAKTMGEAGDPQKMFNTWVNQALFNQNPRITASTAGILVDKLRAQVPASLSVLAFDSTDTLVFPTTLGPEEKKNHERWWKYFRRYAQLSPPTPDQAEDFRQAMAFLENRVGKRITLECLLDSTLKGFITPATRGPPRLISVHYRQGAKAGERPSPDFTGMVLEMEMAGFSPQRKLAESFRVKPPEIPFVLALNDLAPGPPLLPTSATGLSGPAAAQLPIDEVVTNAEGFYLRSRLPFLASHSLVIGLPFSARIALFRTLLNWAPPAGALMILAAIGLFAVVLFRGEFQVPRLALFIPTVFFLAAAIPVSSLIALGHRRSTTMEEAEQSRWQERVQQYLGDMDRRFRDYLETLQSDFFRLSRPIARALKQGRPPRLPDRLKNLSGILYVDADGRGFPYRTTQPLESAPSDSREIKVVQEMFQDLLEQILISRGQPLPPAGNKKIKFSLQDLVGEDSTFLSVFKNLGRIVFFGLDIQNNISYFQLFRDAHHRITGLMLFLSRIDLENYEFFLLELQRLRHSPLPLRLIDSQSGFKGAGFYSTAEPAFLAAIGRTRQTAASELVRLNVRGRHWYAWTYPFRLLTTFPIAGAIPADVLSEERRHIQQSLILWGILGFLLTTGLSWGLWRRLLSPIRGLTAGIHEVSRANFHVRLPEHHSDEFGDLSAAFNQMAEGLQQRERMRRFVSRTAWNQIQADAMATSQVNEVAILFSDIRSFTTLSETYAPAEVVDMLNRYFTLMDRDITAHQGEIWKLIGDAIFAVFPMLPHGEHPAVRAAKAGLAMRRTVAAFNRARLERGLFAIDNGVGIHFGSALIGRIGASSGRLDFTVIGSPVRAATENEALSKRGTASRVMISPSAAGFLQDRVTFAERSIEGQSMLELIDTETSA